MKRARPPSGTVVLAAAVTAMFAVYTVYALSRHHQFLTARYDLGIFAQVVAAYANLRAPIVPLKGSDFHILGDHFHPILVVLAPLWALFPTPETLLVAQAFLVAFSIVPVWLFTRSRLSLGPTAAVAFAYALSWPIQGLIDFDFHEVAFAIPILAWAIYFLDRGKYGVARQAAICTGVCPRSAILPGKPSSPWVLTRVGFWRRSSLRRKRS